MAELIKLGTVLHMEKGKKPIDQTKNPLEGYLPYVDIKAFEHGIIDSYASVNKSLLCENGDLLIVCDGSRSGLTGYAVKGVVGSTLSKISADGLNTKYLHYFIQSKYSLLNTRKKGTGTPHLDANILKESMIAVPPPLEQERIVSRIEELFSQLDASVAELKTAKERLRVYRQAVLKEAFSNLDSNIEQTILSVCENIVDCPHSTPKWTQRGKLCLRTTNFKPGYLDLSEKNYVSEETFCKRITRLVPKPGDVLFSREGAILGIACIIPDGLEACMGQRMMLLRPSKDLLNKYLMYYLNSPKARTLIIENIGGTASPHINVGDIKQFTIPVVPFIQQQSIVAEIESRLSVCDSIEKTVDTALQQAEALRQSILKKAFEGKI